MELIFENIKLRAIEIKDADVLKEMINDPELEYMVNGWSLPVSIDTQIEWIKKIKDNDFRFMIETGHEVVGTCSISSLNFKNSTANLNIKLVNSEHIRGKGIGTRTLKTLINYCFDELNLNCLTAGILEHNVASLNLFNKCGFINEGILRSRIYKRGKYHNVIQLSLLKEEYKSERDR